jgi:L-lactate dehydrogenase complex protein LldF
MTASFKERIHTSIGNPSLQAALDGNAERRRNARLTAYTSLPEDLQVLRLRAHTVRQNVIEHLDDYLEQFITHAKTNGIQVQRAHGGADAVAMILALARQSGAKKIVKSKTMIGEEIELNHALEAAGYEVIETDLGEWIVQLRGERPAHIITPAVHLRRDDVGRLFEQKIGLPYTEDIPTLTAAARRTLRQAFLTADLGISGVNFGVAENGALCLVTNEGNGRMCTTLPPVHIAVMGIERLVPNLDDLALMLSLLPRSATGQKLSVYTSLIYGPRREGEVDGPGQRHLILLDNGRSRLRHSPMQEALYCIRCGACLNACPVFRELGGHAYVGIHGIPTPYPGPIGSVISPGLFGSNEFGNLARASSLCGACQEACPVNIDLPGLLLKIKAGYAPQVAIPESTTQSPGREVESVSQKTGTVVINPAKPVHVPLVLNIGLRGFSWFAAGAHRFSFAQRVADVFSPLLARAGWLKFPAFTGWGLSRDFPQPVHKTFQDRWKTRQVRDGGTSGSNLTSTVGKEPPAFEAATTSATGTADPVKSSDNSMINQAFLADQALSARFQTELELLGGTFIACDPDTLAEKILAYLEVNQIRQLYAWEDDFLPSGLPLALHKAGIEITYTPDPSLPAGLTGALAGVADTGTLVLPGGKGQPQTASLLLETHLVILDAERILPTLSQAFRLPEVSSASSVSLISGPSRTADIEMTLTIGVHGPRNLVVFCVRPKNL